MTVVKEAIGRDFVVRVSSEKHGTWSTPIAISESDADRPVAILSEGSGMRVGPGKARVAWRSETAGQA